MSPVATLPCLYEGCPEKALSFHPFCWEHADREQFAADFREGLRGLSGRGPTALNLKKAHVTGHDFSGLDLRESNFSLSHLASSSFIGANLSGGNFIGTRISSCDFVGSDIYRGNFTKAVIASSSFSHSDLRGSYFVEAHFRDTDLMGAVLFDCVLWNADLSGAQHIKKSSFKNPGSNKRRASYHLSEDNVLGAYESYRSVKHYFYRNGLYEAGSWAAYRELTMERKYFYQKKDPRFIPSLLMDYLSGYTEKPWRVILSSLSIVITFGLIYFFLQVPVEPANPGASVQLGDCLYFSFITFTTVGYGDFIPRSVFFFRFLACVESFSGPFMAGLYIFTLTRRYAAS